MGAHRNMDEVYKVIEVLMILHNMCIEHGDHPEDIWDFDPSDGLEALDDDDGDDDDKINLPVYIDPQANIPAYETPRWLKEMGRQKRQLIFSELFPL